MVVRDYAICYFDLMGQRDGLLRKVRETNDITSVQAEIELTSNAIRTFNLGIAEAKQIFESEPEKLLQAAGLSQDEINRNLPCIKELSLGIQQFSDTTIFYVNADSSVGLGVFVSWCLALSVNYLSLLPKGILIRGGIAIGKGWEISPNCLYGPVLEDAYYLEGKIADFPRIVTTHEVFRKLNEVDQLDAHYNKQTPFLGENIKCAKFFSMDYDGAYIFDYLSLSAIRGYELLWQIPKGLIFREIKEGLRFICEKYNELQHQSLDDCNIINITKKYALLQSYWLQRINLILKDLDSIEADMTGTQEDHTPIDTVAQSQAKEPK